MQNAMSSPIHYALRTCNLLHNLMSLMPSSVAPCSLKPVKTTAQPPGAIFIHDPTDPKLCRKFFGAGELFRTHWPSVMTGCNREKLTVSFPKNVDFAFGVKCLRSMDGPVLIPPTSCFIGRNTNCKQRLILRGAISFHTIHAHLCFLGKLPVPQLGTSHISCRWCPIFS